MSGRSARYRRAVLSDKSYACVHVVTGIRPVLYVAREGDDLMLSCGGHDHTQSTEDWKVVHLAHLTDADTSLRQAVDLADGQQAEREAADKPWACGPITED